MDRYSELMSAHRWRVPEHFNIAQACCRCWAADGERTALYFAAPEGQAQEVSYQELAELVDRFSAALVELGVARGERVAIMLAQRLETAVAHLATYQIGAVAMPLSVLFGPDALEFRINDSAAVVAVTDDTSFEALATVRSACVQLKNVICVESEHVGALTWSKMMDRTTAPFECVRTLARDPAILIYTSGTTGSPKGALMPHQALLGNLTGFTASQNGFPREGDVFWSPADWAWTGGLMDALLPSLYFGQAIVGATARRGSRFDAAFAFELMQRFKVTNSFIFPTALKIMMKEFPSPRDHYTLSLRALMSAGEAVGSAVFDWCQTALGVTVNEMFGQTEINYIVGNSHLDWPARSGSIGRPYPGHQIAILNERDEVCAIGETGEIAANRFDRHGDADPVFFIEYWNNPRATSEKYSGDWCRTGDLAFADADGYFWYQGRSDDMFKSAGYRIGPSEIENCLVKHPAVANAAVVPKPDAERGNLIKAFVVLSVGFEADDALVEELKDHVRGKLAPYEYPREIEFIDALPMTTTGKVQRRILRLREAERASGG